MKKVIINSVIPINIPKGVIGLKKRDKVNTTKFKLATQSK